MKTLFIALPSLLVGGVLFGSSFSRADVGRSGNDWQRTVVVAQADPRPAPRVPAVPPVPATPPTPPTPPTPRTPHSGNGINVQVHGGKIQIDGVDEIIDSSIRAAIDSIKSSDLPKEVKEKLLKRIDKVNTKVKARLSHLDASNLDQLGDQLGKMGDEIGKEMDEFGKEMEKFGEKMGQDAQKNWKKNWRWNFSGGDNDNDNENESDDADIPSPPDVDDPDDLDETVRQLGDLSLKGPQRDQIKKLRADSDRQVEAAKKQLDQAEGALKKALDNAATSDAEVSRAIDAVTQSEAQIRKARILAWHGARRVLDQAQRQKIENAAKNHHH